MLLCHIYQFFHHIFDRSLLCIIPQTLTLDYLREGCWKVGAFFVLVEGRWSSFQLPVHEGTCLGGDHFPVPLRIPRADAPMLWQWCELDWKKEKTYYDQFCGLTRVLWKQGRFETCFSDVIYEQSLSRGWFTLHYKTVFTMQKSKYTENRW